MKYKRVIILYSIILCFSCQQSYKFTNKTGVKDVVEKFGKAECSSNLESLSDLFSNDVIFLPSLGPPICGKEAVQDLYKFYFNKFIYKPKYIINNTWLQNDSAKISGICFSSTLNKNNELVKQDTVNFKLELIKKDGQYAIDKILMGNDLNFEAKIPSLPKPQGKFDVGRRDYSFVDKLRSDPVAGIADSCRLVAFQIWYPCKKTKNSLISYYRNKKTIKYAAEFYNWPLFNNSYEQFLKTNSYENAAILKKPKPYPVIIYNHGYSGFTAVHQVLFEELASNGFVVVSVGHPYESTLFILSGGDVLPFDKTNKIFTAVNKESYSSEVETVKNQIINAYNFRSKLIAYKKLIDISRQNNKSTREWAKDSKFVLDELVKLNNNKLVFNGMLNLNNTGVIGHSLGGATAGQLAISDKRVKAGINLDGFQFGDLINSVLDKPFMFVGQVNNINTIFVKLSKTDCYAVSVNGFQHSSFSDMPLFSSIWKTNKLDSKGIRKLDIQKQIVLTFFRKYLKNENRLLITDLTEKFNEITVEANLK